MKHSYYYVVAGAMCDSTTLLYKVSIGMSLQGRRDYDFLKSYALQHNHYFCVLSAESDIFMRNLLDSLAEFDIKLQHIDARSLVPFNYEKVIESVKKTGRIIVTGEIVAQLALQSGPRLKPKHMTEEQQIAIGANCVLIVLTSLYIFINVFY